MALRNGVTLERFWDLTPWEVSQEIEAERWRRGQQYELAITTAWHTAALAGAVFAGKLPKLNDLLPSGRKGRGQEPKRETQSWQHILSTLKARFPDTKAKADG